MHTDRTDFAGIALLAHQLVLLRYRAQFDETGKLIEGKTLRIVMPASWEATA